MSEVKYIGEQPDPARFFIGVEMDRPRVLAFDSAATFLIFHKYGEHFLFELYEHADEKALRLRSHDAFVFFLWAGLQRDAKAARETLTLEQVADQIVPTNISELANKLLVALSATRRPKSEAAPKNA
jgi:hypothetical protein